MQRTIATLLVGVGIGLIGAGFLAVSETSVFADGTGGGQFAPVCAGHTTCNGNDTGGTFTYCTVTSGTNCTADINCQDPDNDATCRDCHCRQIGNVEDPVCECTL